MRKFIMGLLVGTGLGYGFHESIDRGLREAVDKASEKLADTDTVDEKDAAEYLGASTANPANGSSLPIDRIAEINAATPENPVWITQGEMAKMKQIYLQVALGAGRLKIVGYHE